MSEKKIVFKGEKGVDNNFYLKIIIDNKTYTFKLMFDLDIEIYKNNLEIYNIFIKNLPEMLNDIYEKSLETDEYKKQLENQKTTIDFKQIIKNCLEEINNDK